MKRLLATFIILTTLAFSIVGCSSKIDSASDVPTTITFNGSSTLAPVISKIGQNFMEQYSSWQAVNPDFPDSKINIDVTSGGSGQGVKAVMENTSNFGMVARNIKDDELSEMPTMQQFQLGIDALTISVHPESPLLSLTNNVTQEQLIALFSGEYILWSDLDPSLPSEEIIVVTRDIGGGAHEVFQSKIMGDIDVRADAIQAPSMGALVQKLSDNRFAIGYASFGVVNQNIDKVVPLLINDIEPTEENIKNGTYIIQRPLIVISDDSLSSTEEAFIQYMQSSDGLAVVEALGFIPVQP
ncbi:MAG: phosphate ABC transporter substrate-binding protein [Cellulosilyticaceae bacterium]